MKILTEKDQLRAKLNEIDILIDYSRDEMEKAHRRKTRKENWGFFSFISDEHWLLNLNYERKLTLYKLLLEYREIISDRLLNSKLKI